MRISSEAMAISAWINSEDLSALDKLGLTEAHFKGYREEYRWVRDFTLRYQRTPALSELVSRYPDFIHTEDVDDPRYYADDIKAGYSKRDMLRKMRSASEHLSQGRVSEARDELAGVTVETSRQDVVSAFDKDAFMEGYEREDTSLRVHVPWPTLQSVTGGIGEGEYWVVGARPGQGKSWVLASMAVEAAYEGRKVLFASLEMSLEQMRARTAGILAHKIGFDNVDIQAIIEHREDRSKVRRMFDENNANMPGELKIYDTSQGWVSPALIRGLASEADMIVVDYIGLMRNDAGKRAVDDWRIAAAISNEIKEIALSYSTRVVAASQINRTGEAEELGWRPPKMSSLSQSDAIGQDADRVVTLRDYKDGATKVMGIEKNRHGANSMTERYLWFGADINAGNLDEVSRQEADDLDMEYGI